MFTGIIEAVGRITHLEPRAGDLRLRVSSGTLDMGDVALGDSIAVSGVCLTVTHMDAHGFQADVSGETLARTTLGACAVGDGVNLEKALTLSSRLGGHLVSGHVDAVAEVVSRQSDARSQRLSIRAPDDLARYIAEKGSICVDGVSLTVNAIRGAVFDLNIVPHTLAATTLEDYNPGRRVNLEVDLIARYLERLLSADPAARSDGVSRDFLTRHGFA